MIHDETLLIKECNKNISKILSTSSSNSSRPYTVLFIAFLIISIIISSVLVYFYLYSRLKKYYKLIITSINESYKTSEYKKPSNFFLMV